MTASHRVVSLLFLMVVAACGDGDSSVETTTLAPPPLPEAPTGQQVADVKIAETTFRLFDEGDGCVALSIQQSQLRPTVERLCSPTERGATLSISETCGWWASTDSTASDECDLELPSVIYGIATDAAIGFPCVVHEGSDGTASARILRMIDGRFVLAMALKRQSQIPYLFTGDGRRYNEGAFDSMSQSTFFECEQLAPLFELTDTVYTYQIEVLVELPPVLHRSDVIVGVTGTAGEIQFTGDAAGDGPYSVTIPIRETSRGLDIYLTEDGASNAYLDSAHTWPDEVRAVLRSEGGCEPPIRVLVRIGEAVVESDQTAVSFELLEANCR